MRFLWRLVAGGFVGVAIAMAVRVVHSALERSLYIAAVCAARSPGQEFDTEAAFLIEGFSFGVLPVGSAKDASTLVAQHAAKMLGEIACDSAWIAALAIVFAIAFSMLTTGRPGRFGFPAPGVLISCSLICLAVGISAPIMSMMAFADVPIVGRCVAKCESKSVLSAAEHLWTSGKAWVGALILVFSVFTPVAKSLLTMAAVHARSEGVRATALRVVNAVGKWSMADVFVVAILLAVFSMGAGSEEDATTDAEFGVGLPFFVAYCLSSVVTGQLLARGCFGPKSPGDPAPGLASVLLPVVVGACIGILVAGCFHLKQATSGTTKLDVGSMGAYGVVVAEGPVTLSCGWQSTGREHEGADDTIVLAALVDPAGQALEIWDHKESGSWERRVDKPGCYSLVLSNVGIIRSTARSVSVQMNCGAR